MAFSPNSVETSLISVYFHPQMTRMKNMILVLSHTREGEIQGVRMLFPQK